MFQMKMYTPEAHKNAFLKNMGNQINKRSVRFADELVLPEIRSN